MKRAFVLVVLLGLASSAFAEKVKVQRLEKGGAGNSVETQAPVVPQATGPTSRRGDQNGGRVRVVPQSALPAPDRRVPVLRDSTVRRHMDRRRSVTVVPNRTYWHRVNGHRYAHRLHGGVHWYGFYDGPRFYWTRYYNSHWWWRDARHDRWLYWSNGNWWWPAPGGAVFVYVNDEYQRTSQRPDAVEPPDAVSDPDAGSGEAEGSWSSPDGKRNVQVFGPRSEAFLYDVSGSTSVYLAYLGQDVERIRFSGGKHGEPLSILVDYSGGGFVLYDGNGRQSKTSSIRGAN